MKYRTVFLVLLLAGLVSSCAGNPRSAALDYWTKRTRLDPGSAQYVTPTFQAQARSDIEAFRDKMRLDHPKMDDYRFDFADLQAQVMKTAQDRAIVLITGTARVYDDTGRLFDENKVEERLELRSGSFGWRVDYSYRLAGEVRATLEDLAQAQKTFRAAKGYYAGDTQELTGLFNAPAVVSVSILEAGRDSWRGAAVYNGSGKAYIFDSKAACVLPDPIDLKRE